MCGQQVSIQLPREGSEGSIRDEEKILRGRHALLALSELPRAIHEQVGSCGCRKRGFEVRERAVVIVQTHLIFACISSEIARKVFVMATRRSA
jgi:hypothetical protein